MHEVMMRAGGTAFPARFCRAVVVGSGAAGFRAALELDRLGADGVAVVAEDALCGTSRNAGSDKQTYYKLSLSGDCPDSPGAMARDLFAGRCVDGDHALVEAALSARAFLSLCDLGVPFPTNLYGEYVGYRTDHDPRARATSAGPLTSRMMTERLESAVRARGVPVFGGYQAIAVLKDADRAVGVLTMRRDTAELSAFFAGSVVFATGGPAGVYADSVYPAGHHGATGVAMDAGAAGRNLTEWQYGLASLSPRWNVSGTYMQALPRFVSVGADGREREFLAEAFQEAGEGLSRVFRKGYEWPFDSRKARNGSSVIDLLAHRERMAGRRVYLDFTKNPYGMDSLPYDRLDREASDYLTRAGACLGRPIDRLLAMNAPAYDLYLGKGVDLKKERLEIALCAQHHNGGLSVDAWWRTSVPGLYAVGEAAATHGVYRPGGSALNAGQVGALRAARHIAAKGASAPSPDDVSPAVLETVQAHMARCARLVKGSSNVSALLSERGRAMSGAASALRDPERMRGALSDALALLASFDDAVSVAQATELPDAYRLRDALTAQAALLTAMLDYTDRGGKSRGSAIYTDRNGEAPEGLPDAFRFQPDDGGLDGMTQVTRATGGQFACEWRAVRPLPEGGGFFENVWREYRENGGVWEEA